MNKVELIDEITKKTEDVTDEKGYSLSNSNNTHAYDSDYCNWIAFEDPEILIQDNAYSGKYKLPTPPTK